MGIRPFKMPGDLAVMVDLLPPSFQYPENPEWSIEADEMESITGTMQGVRRLWPLIRLLQVVVPSLRDIMRGYIWEEDGQPVGLTNVLREGDTSHWLIGNVSVLPEYRRRGIARKLVEASVEYAQGRGAQSIVLDVIAGNVPAYTLYERLGFEHYGSHSELVYEHDTPPEPVPAPDGCQIEAVPVSDWRPRYALAKRITPATVQKYMPVEEGHYRQPAVVTALLPLLARAMGARPQPYHVTRDGAVVATVRTQARTRAGGMNNLGITLDPAHADLAPYIVRHVTNALWARSPGRRIELAAQDWQAALLAAALDAGYTRKYEYHSMGMVCQA